MQIFEQINELLINYQLLVISVMMPLLSGIIAFFSSRYSTKKALKAEQKKLEFQSTLKISEYRQNWINELRDCMSEFQSRGILPENDPTQDRDFYELGTKIELLMNPNDPDYLELQNLMYNFLFTQKGDVTTKYSNNAPFINVCQRILKREWERLKDDLKEKSIMN